MKYTYSKAFNKFTSTLSKNNQWILATSYKNHVTARMVSTICISGKLLFQTDKKFQKYHQIKNNPNVAICNGNCTIEGIASDRGHPLNTNNVTFLDQYKLLHASAFQKYSKLKNEVVIEISPIKVKYWEYDTKGKPWYIEIDLEKQKVKCNEYKF